MPKLKVKGKTKKYKYTEAGMKAYKKAMMQQPASMKPPSLQRESVAQDTLKKPGKLKKKKPAKGAEASHIANVLDRRKKGTLSSKPQQGY